MIEDPEHVVEELAAYTLGSLDRDERARVEAHVTTCDTCARRLMEYRAVVAALPFALEPVTPPSDAWRTIRAGARRRRLRIPVWTRMVVRASRSPVVRWSAVAAVAACLLAWNVVLEGEVTRSRQGPQVEKLARRPARLVILTGTGQPNASARIFAAVDGHSGHMAISGLPPLGAGRVYQLWFVVTAGPAKTAATFTVDGEGRAWVVISVPAPLEDTRAIVITEEPAPGSPSLSGALLLEARQWR